MDRELMTKGTFLSDLEQLLLASVLLLRGNAYGMTVHEKTEELAARRRPVSLGSAYMALERLEQKGYVKSRMGEATAERGGKPKKYFEVTAAGELALMNSLQVASNIIREIDDRIKSRANKPRH